MDNCTKSHPHEDMNEICGFKTIIARKKNEIAHLKAALAEKDAKYNSLLKQAVDLATYSNLLSDGALRDGAFDNESDTWPVYHHVGGLHNECSGTVAEFVTKKLAEGFVTYHHDAQQFLASPEVQAFRDKEQQHG